MSEHINRQVKSSLFIDYFGMDEIVGKANFLALYNAIHDTNYTLENTTLRIREIDNTMYKTFRNDIGMELNDRMVVLIEHQSTINYNMPLRFLEYISRIYTSMVPGKIRYGEKRYEIPTPEFIVFYNGRKAFPESYELRLSDSFREKTESPKLELTVKVYNINRIDLPIVRKCDKLREYTEFIDFIYKNADITDADSSRMIMNKAIRKGLLPDYLERKITEVINMLTAEYDYDLDIFVKKEEAYEDGFKQGEKNKALEAAVTMIKNFGHSIEEVCATLNVNREDVVSLL